jgi:MarR family
LTIQVVLDPRPPHDEQQRRATGAGEREVVDQQVRELGHGEHVDEVEQQLDPVLSRSGLTRIVDELEALELVRREPDENDGRVLVATLTPLGRRQFAAARRTHLANVRKLFLGPLTAEQRRGLGASWQAMLERPGPDAGRARLVAGAPPAGRARQPAAAEHRARTVSGGARTRDHASEP